MFHQSKFLCLLQVFFYQLSLSFSLSSEESIMYQQLNTILKGISHERADVKMHATRALQDILKNNKVMIMVAT